MLCRYYKIWIPIPLPESLVYKTELAHQKVLSIGQRVLVPLGKKKIYAGVVIEEIVSPPDYEIKSVTEILDARPICTLPQLTLLQWMAHYYMCNEGEALNAALPSQLKLKSQTYVSVSDLSTEDSSLSEIESQLLQVIRGKNATTIKEVEKIFGKETHKVIQQLANKEHLQVFDKLQEKWKQKKQKKIRLCSAFTKQKEMETLLDQLEKYPLQQNAVLSYLREVPVLENPKNNKNGVFKKAFLAKNSTSSVKTLLNKKVFKEWDEVISRLGIIPQRAKINFQLSQSQQASLIEIKQSFEKQKPVLFHGVTGSGKTEIYIELIKQTILQKKQVLLLLPEIAISTQIITRLKEIFGHSFGVYHSKFSDAERVEVWNSLLQKKVYFIVGVRSAILLPFDSLGLIIVDEEHDSSYKQTDSSPRYHARDVALYLASVHKASILLGSATPSIESFAHTQSEKYDLVSLKSRFNNVPLPTMEVVDMTKERKRKTLKGNFSSILYSEIEHALNHKEQVILLQNRRGYSQYVLCNDCSHIPMCKNCDVSLTYHQFYKELSCHYCGYKQALPLSCVKCHSTNIKTVGFGTEEIEEEAKILFNSASIERMDQDTTSGKNAHQNIIANIENKNTDILIGTQMLSKGLHFDYVNLVGVINADQILCFPNFRATERTYQLISQVGGRAGRTSKQGKVIIQTNQPDHPIFSFIIQQSYQEFYTYEINERYTFNYPPYTRLVKILFKHQDKKTSTYAATLFYDKIVNNASQSLIIQKPVEPVVSKIKNQYIMHLFIKIKKNQQSLDQIKSLLFNTKKFVHEKTVVKGCKIIFDVDPII